MIWANEQFPRKSSAPRGAVQIWATGKCRVYPHVVRMIELLLRKGHEVFMLGGPGDPVPIDNKPGLRNLIKEGLSFRQSCAVLNGCDYLVGPDSALVHVAGARGVPAVALYGPFPWALRTAYSPSITAIQGYCAVSPCFHHVNPSRGDEFPKNCPSGAKGYCEALGGTRKPNGGGYSGGIDPERVVAKVQLVARKFKMEELEK